MAIDSVVESSSFLDSLFIGCLKMTHSSLLILEVVSFSGWMLVDRLWQESFSLASRKMSLA
jgi:hypothetical protein